MFSMLKYINIWGLLLFASCTQPVSNQFELQQQTQGFSAVQAVNTKLDLLWVIDNSGSMESVQTKVRAGIQQFAQLYMKPTWDIRVAAITTDTYLADPTFWAGPQNQTSYLTTVRPGTADYNIPYLNGGSENYGGVTVPPRSKHYYDATSWVTSAAFPLFEQFLPSAYSPPSVTLSSGGQEVFLGQGLRIIDSKPQLGSNWSKLLVGNHDGPQLSMCWDNDESSPQFIYGVTSCFHRDDPADSQYHIGTANCVNPATGETGPSQCVNTFANNSVHTGLPIISTLPPKGVAGDQTWINNLIANFQVNLTPSTVGNGSERAFQSVLRFLSDNEKNPSTAFFRPGSLRTIIFVGDEDDQSQLADVNQYQYGTTSNYGSGTPGAYTLGTGTKAHMIPENASAPFLCKVNYSAPNPGYFFPTGDPGYCVDPAWLIPVSTVKQDLDTFFHQLDGTLSTQNSNYFVATITTMNTPGLSQLGYGYISVRYPALANLVGNGSLVLDLTQSDYSPLLNQVGNTILQSKGTFQLARAPTSQETTQMTIVHGNGTSTQVSPSQFVVKGSVLTITDLSVVASFATTDQIEINYTPQTVF